MYLYLYLQRIRELEAGNTGLREKLMVAKQQLVGTGNKPPTRRSPARRQVVMLVMRMMVIMTMMMMVIMMLAIMVVVLLVMMVGPSSKTWQKFF